MVSSRLGRGVVLAVLIATIGAVHMASLREGHAWGDDFAHYLLHAQNLAEGRPYATIGYVYNPSHPTIGPPTYPPGCPAVLAPLYAWFGLDLAVFKLEMIAFFLVFLVALWLCFREDLGLPGTVALLAIVGLNHFFLKDTNSIGSDMPFLAWLYLAIFAIRRAELAPQTTWRPMALYCLAGLLSFLAFSTRTLGALLVPAMLGQQLVTTRRVRVPVILATAIFTLLAILQSVFFHSDRQYLDQFGAGPMVLVHNAGGYLVRLATFWHNGHFQTPSMVLFAAMSLLAVFGYVESLRRRITVCEAFAAFYVAVILLWPSYQGERYLYPVIPLYVCYALRGLAHPWFAGRARLRRGVVAALVLAIGLTYAARLATWPRGPLQEGVAKPQSQQLFEYLRNTTGPGDVIVFIKPRALALFTGRRASVYHLAEDDRTLWDYFRKIGATRLVVVENDTAMANVADPAMLAFLRGFVERNRGPLRREWANSDFTIYRLPKVAGTLRVPSASSSARASLFGAGLPTPPRRSGRHTEYACYHDTL